MVLDGSGDEGVAQSYPAAPTGVGPLSDVTEDGVEVGEVAVDDVTALLLRPSPTPVARPATIPPPVVRRAEPVR